MNVSHQTNGKIWLPVFENKKIKKKPSLDFRVLPPKKTKLIKLINKELVNEKSNSKSFEIINRTISNCSNGDNINVSKINLKNENYKQQINLFLLQTTNRKEKLSKRLKIN